MLRIPRRFGHILFGIIQSGLTCAVATTVAHLSIVTATHGGSWAASWLLSWVAMLPIVILAAPLIGRIVNMATYDELSHSHGRAETQVD